jgi:rubrerythrin
MIKDMEEITCKFCHAPFPVEITEDFQKCPVCGTTKDVQDRLDWFYQS